jgi:hypothetical protein
MSIRYAMKAALGFSLVFVLASCGGGGDISGSGTEFLVSPKDTKLTVFSTVDGDCSGAVGGSATVFTIIGGQAPFRIVNAFPDGLEIDKTEATGKDPKFTVRPRGRCGDPFVITVLDYHSKVATVEFTVESEKPEE